MSNTEAHLITLSILCLLPLDEFHITFAPFATQVFFSQPATGEIKDKASRMRPLLKI